mmetsp:Transcript_19842/g.64546  ORF Transcript_19842/g.64546 Transcript_19842/m.64546 type:complete len:596 (+) Transcript_19842:90-1877(+)
MGVAEVEGLVSWAALLTLLLIICAGVATTHQWMPWFLPWASESRFAILLGIAVGGAQFVFYETVGRELGKELLYFNTDLFFDLLLPFIIFSAGFGIKKMHFFRNIGIISMYGVIGTFFSFLSTTILTMAVSQFLDAGVALGDAFYVGAFFACTDTVSVINVLDQASMPMLYSVMFGEGVINDAVSVVLLFAASTVNDTLTVALVFELLGRVAYLSMLSSLVGILFGLLTGFVGRHVFARNHSAVHEVAMLIFLGYLGYLISVWANLSGILTIFWIGVLDSHYTFHSLSVGGKAASGAVMNLLASLAENTIYIMLGINIMNPIEWSNTGVVRAFTFAGLEFCAIVLNRALMVFGLTAISNLFRSDDFRISFRQQMLIFSAGLIRGSVTGAMAYRSFPNVEHHFKIGSARSQHKHMDATILTGSILIVSLTSVILGTLSKPIVDFCLGTDAAPPQLPSPPSPSASPRTTDGSTSQRSARRARGTWSEMSALEETLLPPLMYGSTELDKPALTGGRLDSARSNASSEGRTPRISPDMIDAPAIAPLAVWWIDFDKRYLQPVFGGQHAPTVDPSLSVVADIRRALTVAKRRQDAASRRT